MDVEISSGNLSTSQRPEFHQKSSNHDQKLIRSEDYHTEFRYQILNESDQWLLRYRPETSLQVRAHDQKLISSQDYDTEPRYQI